MLNLITANPTQAGYPTVYPAGAAGPTASNLNVSAGEQISNRVITEVGTGDQVETYNHTGTADWVADVDGYSGTASGTAADASVFYAVSPEPIADTRSGLGGKPLTAGGTEAFQVTSEDGIPAESASGPFAAAANLTVTRPTSGQHS